MKRLYVVMLSVLFFVTACSYSPTGCPSLEVDAEKCEFGTYTTNQSGCLFTLCRPSPGFDCNNLSQGSEYYDGCNTCYCEEEKEVCTEISCKDLEKEETINETHKPRTLEEYYSEIDSSCEEDNDCAIKDIHNCCGYYPKCVNVQAETNPDLVMEICEEKETTSVCGFPVIESCVCVDSQCTAK